MSTKTLRKRIALVAVAALGFGVLTSGPSTAADAVASTSTASLQFNTTSITAVGALDSTTETKNAAVFRITAIGNGGSSSQLKALESITATVSAVPSPLTMTANAADLNFSFLSGTGYGATFTSIGTAGATALVNSSHTSSVDQARIAANGTTPDTNGVYFLAVTPADGKNPMDAGYYTIRVRLQDASGFITTYSLRAQFVTSAADSGAVIVPTVTGRVFAGDAIGSTAAQNIRATLNDANGGLIQTVGATAYNPGIPTLNASIIDLTTGVAKVTGAVSAIGDTGSAALDHTALVTTTTTPYTQTERRAATAINAQGDGTYGVTTTALGAAAAGGDSIRVRYGATSASAALTIVPAATTGTTGTSSFTATGGALTADNVALPLTTTSVTFNHTVTTGSGASLAPVTAYDVYYTLSYGASCLVADQSPLATTAPLKLTTDSAGKVSVTVTSLKTKDACSATVTWTGAATPGNAQTATWQAPVATRSVVSTGSYQALAKSTHTITWTVTDQFGAPDAAEVVTFTASGANIPTAGLASKMTDANGQVSFTWTDAAGVPDSTTLGFTSLRLNTVGGVTPATNAAAVVVTYKATLDVVASLRATYTDTSGQVLVPTTNIGGTTGIAVSAADQIDTTKVVTSAATAPWVELTFTARNSALTAVTGVPTTVTVTGAQLVGSDGKLGNSIVVYANNAVRILGTKAGVATVTATNGTLSSTATINFVNASADARVLSLKESAGLVTATVADAFGNGVEGIVVSVSGSGGAWFGNGATSGTFTTSTDGTVTFAVTGAGTVSASIATSNAKTAFLANSGNTTGTVVTPGAPAGVRVASVATLGRTDAATATANANAAAIAALKAQLDAAAAKAAADKASSDAAIAAAQAAAVEAATAAADAAAEATDAANAATDAANASAEAGDAATAAAQDAADAVAALATQVSEMIDTLKKQITALTNLVIKIQKKVKA